MLTKCGPANVTWQCNLASMSLIARFGAAIAAIAEANEEAAKL
jgi:hypothetical protein